ncbi:MAG: hypothetical protein ACTSVI_03925 [Promethearchaeota archaeon]
MKDRQKKLYFGTCWLVVFWILGIIFYYLEEGNKFLEIDAYGRSFWTTWMDFERFWGLFLLSTAEAFSLAAWIRLFLPKRYELKINLKKAPWTLILIIILFLASMFSFWSPNSPQGYNALLYLGNGWYDDFAAVHFLEFTFILLGGWVFIVLPKVIKKGWHVMRWNSFSALYFVLSLSFWSWISITSSWDLSTMFNVEKLLVTFFALLLFILPYLLVNLSILFFPIASEDTFPIKNKTRWGRANYKDLLIFLGIFLSFLVLIMTVFFPYLNLNISISSTIFFTHFFTWLYIANQATFLIHVSMKKSTSVGDINENGKQ